MATKEEVQNLASANFANYPNTPLLESHQAKTAEERTNYNDRLAEDRRRAEAASKR